MLRVCVVGHSLIPSANPLNVPSVQLDIIRHPGATINSLTDKLTDINFWSRHYDGIILCIGGNDLCRLSVDEVFSRLCDLARRLRTQTTFLIVCIIEYRLYATPTAPRGNKPPGSERRGKQTSPSERKGGRDRKRERTKRKP